MLILNDVEVAGFEGFVNVVNLKLRLRGGGIFVLSIGII